MTVEELIGVLKGFESDARVLVDGYEDGCDEPKVRLEKVVADPTTGWWSGDWQVVPSYEDTDPPHTERVVVVGR